MQTNIHNMHGRPSHFQQLDQWQIWFARGPQPQGKECGRQELLTRHRKAHGLKCHEYNVVHRILNHSETNPCLIKVSSIVDNHHALNVPTGERSFIFSLIYLKLCLRGLMSLSVSLMSSSASFLQRKEICEADLLSKSWMNSRIKTALSLGDTPDAQQKPTL